MSMSKTRPQWPVLIALSLGSWLHPLPATAPTDAPYRLVAERDRTFSVPDSVRALLSRVTAIAAARDSSLYLADPSLGAILNLTPNGDFRRVLGRRGSGPGEFNAPLLVGFHRDTLWAVDPASVRLTLLPTRGPGVVTVPLGLSAATLPDRSRPQARQGLPSAVLPDGNLLIEQPVRDSQDGGTQWSQVLLLRASRNLEVLDTIAQSSMTHSMMVFVNRDGEEHLVQPFGDDPLYAVSSDGSLLVLVHREVPAKGGKGTFTVTGWRGGKEKLFERRVEYDGRRIVRNAVDSVIQLFTNPRSKGGYGSHVPADSLRRRLYRPATYPPVESVRVSRNGMIWLKVRLADSPEGVGDWLVLSPRGFEMYRVSLPATFRMLEADRRTVWGVDVDSLDVPLLVRYSIPGPGQAG